jgi:Right handed beta helix region
MRGLRNRGHRSKRNVVSSLLTAGLALSVSLSSASATDSTSSGVGFGQTPSIFSIDRESARAGRAPGPLQANLWIDADGGSCVRRGTAAAYNNARACTWDQANSKCAGGDTVRVKRGNYGDITLRGSNNRKKYCNVFTVRGETVTLRALDLGIFQTCQSGPTSASTTNWFKLTGPIRMAEFRADCSDHVYLDNVDVDVGGAVRELCRGDSGATHLCTPQPFHVGGGDGTRAGDIATNFTLRNSKVHDALNAGAMMWLGTPGANFVLDHNKIYNLINDTNGDIHDECIRFSDLSHVRFTRNHMWSCFVMDIYVNQGSRFFDVLIENNVFEAPTGSVGNAGNAIFVGKPPDTVVIRYNTFGSSGMTVLEHPIGGGLTVVGNYFDTNAPCLLQNTTYAYNVTPAGVNNCGGPGSRSFSAGSLRAGFFKYAPYKGNGGAAAEPAGDYRLLRRSPLINRGNRTSYPRSDRSGIKRYKGRAPDVGAYESSY